MNEFSSDEARLSAAEKQMRRALGLERHKPASPVQQQQTPSPSASHHSRKFVREGDVPVTIVHHDTDAGGVNRLRMTQQALQEETSRRERAEHQVRELEASVRSLQTSLAHERLARDETMGRLEAERQTLAQDLAAAREALEVESQRRVAAEQERDGVLARQLEETRKPAKPSPPRKQAKRTKPPHAHSAADESEVVEWWVPGWREKYLTKP